MGQAVSGLMGGNGGSKVPSVSSALDANAIADQALAEAAGYEQAQMENLADNSDFLNSVTPEKVVAKKLV